MLVLPRGGGFSVPVHPVNLDALIPREVLDVQSAAQLSPPTHRPSFAIGELAHGELTYSVLRKPDFQRATCD